MKRLLPYLCLCFLVAAALLQLWACARIDSPDGGPYDETPPKVVHTTPRFGAVNEKNVKRITIEFDEIIRIDNANEKVVISPPQIEQPEIEANGRRITVTLLDSVRPNTTYTIDFADAIVDNNEGNPYGDYAFTFSTGEKVDTFQMSGYVLNAEDLEPVKGMLVGLYKIGELDSTECSLPDSTFRTRPFERVSRTDSRGHFVVKGLSPGRYRAFALKDINQNFIYDQPTEQVAFSHRVLSTSSRPDIRPDTVWHDSIHYDSIVYTPYIHYYPDDVVLTAFAPVNNVQHLLKSERPTLQHFTLYFTAPADTLPCLTGLNFDAEQAFVIDARPKRDTIDYWIRDSLVYNLDTLHVQIDFLETDTLGQLVPSTDTLRLVSRLTKERMEREYQQRLKDWEEEYRANEKARRRVAQKQAADSLAALQEKSDNLDGESARPRNNRSKKKDDDDIVVPPLPEEFLSIKVSDTQSMDPDNNVDFHFQEPLDTVDLSKIHFTMKVDTLFQPVPFLFRRVQGTVMDYRLYAEWEADSTYQIEVDTAAFVNIYGKRNEAFKRTIRMKSLDSYSTLFVVLQGDDWNNAVVELLNPSEKVVKQAKAKDNRADFYFITPGIYYLRLYRDLNANGQWDTGDYDLQLQPEPVYYYPTSLNLKAQWEITQDWNPVTRPLFLQKPEKITKQKPEKAKTIKSRNAEREQKKKQQR